MLDVKVMHSMFALIRTVFRSDDKLSEEDEQVIRSNIGQIFVISERCDMAHLVGYALEQADLISPENEYHAAFQEKQFMAMMRGAGHEHELERLKELYERHKIAFIPLKGSVIRTLYPESWMRTSSDIDILFHPEDLERAEKLAIEELGYKKGKESDHDHSLHSPGGVHVELHFDLFEEGSVMRAKEALSDIWSESFPIEDGRSEYCLSDAVFYCYHIAHIAKHVRWAGIGMRPFLDLWLINNSSTQKDNRRELLAKAALDRFALLCEELSEYWLGDKEELCDSAKKLELYILNSGTYGSMENRIAIIHEAQGGTRGYIVRRIFLPYPMLAGMYPIIKKHKWLTPFCEVLRWFKLLSKGMMRKAIKEVQISKSTSKEKTNEMQRFMTDIGL